MPGDQKALGTLANPLGLFIYFVCYIDIPLFAMDKAPKWLIINKITLHNIQ